MSFSTLRGAIEEGELLSGFINSCNFNDWILNNLIVDEEFFEDSDVSEVNNNVERRSTRRNFKPPGKSKIENYFTDTVWGRLITDESVKDANSQCGKLFRRRFRVPFPVFELLVRLTKENNLFDYSMEYKVLIPIELSVMGVLRMLGRGECLDTIEELSGISKSSMQRLFQTWTKNFVAEFKNQFIGIPTDEEMLKIMEV
jgi:hypothetical protein